MDEWEKRTHEDRRRLEEAHRLQFQTFIVDALDEATMDAADECFNNNGHA